MMMIWLTLALNQPVPACYGGFALLVYLPLAVMQRRHLPHAVAFGVGALLAGTLAVCTAVAH